MASVIESGWLYLTKHFSDFQLTTIGSFAVHESALLLSGLPFIFMDRAGLLRKYKIQTKHNSPTTHGKCITRLFLFHFFFSLPLVMASYPVYGFTGMKSSLPLPSWKVVLSQIIFYFILEDFMFYWGHRVLHTKWMYEHVHYVHHEFDTPFGPTAEYAHPVEVVIIGSGTVMGPAITGPHLITFWLWLVLRVIAAVEAHSGYHFPWSLSNFLPFYAGAEFHDHHHRLLNTKPGNYASTFAYLDWIFGTDKGFRKRKALEHNGADINHKQT